MLAQQLKIFQHLHGVSTLSFTDIIEHLADTLDRDLPSVDNFGGLIAQCLLFGGVFCRVGKSLDRIAEADKHRARCVALGADGRATFLLWQLSQIRKELAKTSASV